MRFAPALTVNFSILNNWSPERKTQPTTTPVVTILSVSTPAPATLVTKKYFVPSHFNEIALIMTSRSTICSVKKLDIGPIPGEKT